MILHHLGRVFFYLLLLASLGVAAAAAVIYAKIEPQLPSIEVLRDVQLQEPLRVYTSDRRLLAEFGEKRRNPIKISQVPDAMVRAFLSAEDDRFFEHAGVDFQGLLRAAVELLRTGKKRQGGSTITMQVARNFFLSSEKTYLRKLTEILLAYKIEGALSKEEILELYLNKIYLGQRAYGVEAAAQVYYGMSIADLSVARMAMIAALPKAPSRINPINNPEAAIDRRNYVLGRMHQLGYLDTAAYEAAVAEPDGARVHRVQAEASAAYVAEMVRHEMVERYGASVYTSGYEVVTTIDVPRQAAATRALRKDLLDYSKRHGYRGAEASINIDEVQPDERVRLLADYVQVGGLVPALVTRVDEKSIEVLLKSNETISIGWDGISWARPYRSVNRLGPAPKQAGDVVAIGDIVRVSGTDKDWELAQIPVVEGALVSLLPTDGAIVALVGGFDFNRSKFNRATQAIRQPGSAFKPIVYSAAMDNGFTPSSIIVDSPIIYDDPTQELKWKPSNYSEKFYGPTPLRTGLVQSRNVITIKLVQKLGIQAVIQYAKRFGIEEELPEDLSISLGSMGITPIGLTSAYTVFANLGLRSSPWFIMKVEDREGNVLEQGGAELTRSLSEDTAFIMQNLLRSVVQSGTGWRAKALGRPSGGKTGTTNDMIDAWYMGFTPKVVTGVWVGFDEVAPMGQNETGSRAAAPIWVGFMQKAMADRPVLPFPAPPPGIEMVKVEPDSGLLAGPGSDRFIYEAFKIGTAPREYAKSPNRSGGQYGTRSYSPGYVPQSEVPGMLPRDF